MSSGRRSRRRVGALFWVAGLFLASALVRLGLELGPAVAREAHAAEGHAETADAGPVPGVEGADLEALLRELKSREAAVRLRETQIEDRMKALDIAESAIERKMAALTEAEESLKQTLALADGASETDLARLTAVYEQMKPKHSAPLFEQMDPAFAAGFLARMKPEAAAGILAGLSPQAAYTVSAILAGRNATVPKQ